MRIRLRSIFVRGASGGGRFLSPRRAALSSAVAAWLAACAAASLGACHGVSDRAPGADGGDAASEETAIEPPLDAAEAEDERADAGDAGDGEGGAAVAPQAIQGGSIARAGAQLVFADEDAKMLRILPVPGEKPATKRIDGGAHLVQRGVPLPGRPANVAVSGDRLFVTIRDPGLLLVLRLDPAQGAVEVARVDLPADAWGLALTPDASTALVTSAWTHKLTAVDVGAARARWTIDLPREPRGIAILPDRPVAYVSHLTSSGISRVDAIDGASPAARTIALAPAPLRNPTATPLDASLGYALLLSPDGSRLFAPRHALGAAGNLAWFGAATVDALSTAKDEPLAPPRVTKPVSARVGEDESPLDRLSIRDSGALAIGALTPFVQPRAAVFRRGEGTVVVIGEGSATVTEHEALALDPGLSVRARYDLDCDGASGIALSEDERVGYVYCRASNELAVLDFDKMKIRRHRVADDPLPELAAQGRRSFFDARNASISGGLACAGCHPEGRDDGHVWHEIETRHATFTVPPGVEPRVFVGGPAVAGTLGLARQTPMLAGRVRSDGPFGWHAENPDLESRVEEGIHLHRWNAPPRDPSIAGKVAPALAAYLRTGLVPPPKEARPLSDEEQRGQAIFTSREAQCSFCHTPDNDYTDRAPHPLKPWSSPGFDADEAPFRAPSLLFVGGTAPYYHDGSAPSLERLVLDNKDRMGKTKQLSPADQRALVAFLRTL